MLNQLNVKQIPTTYKTIKKEWSTDGVVAIQFLFICFTHVAGSANYVNQVKIVARFFDEISRLVYKGKDGKYKKPTVEKYRKELFENNAKTPQQVFDFLQYFGIDEEE